MAGLNPRQQKFVERYLATGNATQSYIDAGYKCTRDTAEANAARLLGDARVRATVESARAAANETQGITAEWYAARVKIEAEREGEGSSHGARVSALRLAGELLGVGVAREDDKGKAGGVPVELVTRMFAVLGTRPQPGGTGGAAGSVPVDTEAGGAVGGVAE